MSEYMWDNDYNGVRYAGVKTRDYWEVKRQWCHSQCNNNSVFNGSVSVSCKGVTNK